MNLTTIINRAQMKGSPSFDILHTKVGHSVTTKLSQTYGRYLLQVDTDKKLCWSNLTISDIFTIFINFDAFWFFTFSWLTITWPDIHCPGPCQAMHWKGRKQKRALLNWNLTCTVVRFTSLMICNKFKSITCCWSEFYF